MKEVTLIFPDQLFETHPALELKRPVYLAEEFLFFRVQAFHKQRLVLLRAAMKGYADFLTARGYQVTYIDSSQLKNRGDLFTVLSQKGFEKIHVAEFTDDWLRQDLEKAAIDNSWKLHYYRSPMFLCSEAELKAFFKNKNKYSMAQFYAYQRKRLGILMEGGTPLGGKFSFDKENRKRIPKGCRIPTSYMPKETPLVQNAVKYVEKEFPNAIGEAKPFYYPTTFNEAKNALFDFIKNRLALFGDYEDAIKENESFLFHSVLSPLLNIGLLTPDVILQAVLSSEQEQQIPLNSLEGFIRQIIGWREYIRACYLFKGRRQRSSNHLHHKNPIPEGFWNGTTGIKPIDCTIKRILKTGYCHHIERLMVLGNFLLLIESDPHAVYEWFMAFFVDAYDWVMVPNVYGMSQYADNGEMTTKPYISGSNYILKMSDYPKGDWVDIWDGLFWRFLDKHTPLFDKNPRTKVLVGLLEKNSVSILPKIALAKQWLSQRKLAI